MYLKVYLLVLNAKLDNLILETLFLCKINK